MRSSVPVHAIGDPGEVGPSGISDQLPASAGTIGVGIGTGSVDGGVEVDVGVDIDVDVELVETGAAGIATSLLCALDPQAASTNATNATEQIRRWFFCTPPPPTVAVRVRSQPPTCADRLKDGQTSAGPAARCR